MTKSAINLIQIEILNNLLNSNLKMAKGKKAQKAAPESNQKVQNRQEEQEKATKNKQTQQIMNAITNMDLDNADFIDVKAFDQSKAILVNALDQLEMYIGYFQKGEYDKFPKAS